MSSSAPIALFAYDRPEHTRRTLEALSANEFASTATLHVFCDGPMESATPEDRQRIDCVREIAGSRNWCGQTSVHKRATNLGLARSVRGGVDWMLEHHNRVIILEDDIETSPGFLSYMNEALSVYEQDDRVMHVGGYLPETSYRSLLPETFFSIHMSCWGWGTWKRAWQQARWDPSELLSEVEKSRGGRRRFDVGGTAHFSHQLDANINGQLQTWAIFWAASIYLADGLCLLPSQSLVRNIGTDGSGVHFRDGVTTAYDVETATSIPVVRGDVHESRRGAFYLRSFYKYGRNSGLMTRARSGLRTIRHRAASRLRSLT